MRTADLLRTQATALRTQAAVLEALAASEEHDAGEALLGEMVNGPKLLDRAGLARAVGKSVASVDRLVREGLPFLAVGDVRRFELDAVLAWLRARGAR